LEEGADLEEVLAEGGDSAVVEEVLEGVDRQGAGDII
jgi:hypothetical protein